MKKGSFIHYFFRHADSFDMFLMTLGFIGAVGDGLSMPVIMLMTSKLMNNLGNGDKLTFLHNMNKNAENLLFASCGILLACFLEGYCWARTGERHARRMRIKYLKAILRQEVGYFDMRATSTTQIIASVSGDSLVIQDTISEKVPNFLANMSMFVGGILFAFILLWRLALVAFPFILVLVAPSFMYGHVLIGLARKNTEAYSKAGGIAEQAIASVKTVYSFVGEDNTVIEFSKALQEMVKIGKKQGLAKGLVMGGNGLLFAVWAFMFWYGSRLVMYHGAKGGDVFAVGVLVGLTGQALGSGLSNLKAFSEASSAGERIMEVIERVPEIDSEDKKGEVLQQLLGEVEFRNVEFEYPSRPTDIVLKNFCLKVPAGKTLALVGGSGSGKSTIISLLQRFYNLNKGEIRIDGVEINKFQLKWLRSQMGLVSQEPSLFATSIKENIMFGKEGQVTMEEILEACEIANAHNFISQLPKGYDTQVGERGVHISGGEKQRIAIARAMIRKPRILLLDEATSALDSESERNVQEALDNAALGKTTVVIAHRLSTIRNADIIAVIQGGNLVEIGSHDELCKDLSGAYNSLLKLQQVDVKSNFHEEKEPNYRYSDVNSCEYDSRSEQNSYTELIMKKAPNEANKDKIQKTETPSFVKLLVLNLPEWKQALTGCLGAAIAGGIQPLFGYCMGNMVYVYLLPKYTEMRMETQKYSLIFCCIAMVLVAVNILQHSNFATMGEYLTKRIRENMLAKLLTFEVEWFEQNENSTGAVCTRLAKDANLVRSLVGDRMSLLLQTLFLVLISSTMGLIIAWRLAVVIIATQPIIVVCLYGRMVLLKKMSKNSLKSQEESSKIAAEAVANIRTITCFSSQARILSMFEKAQEVPRQGSNRQSFFAGVGLGTCQALISINWALSFWYGGRLVYDGFITTKAFLEAFLMLINTGKIIADVGSITTDIARGSGAVNSVFQVLNRHSKIHPDDPKGYEPRTIKGHVEFRDVHFFYPSRPNAIVFRKLSFVIEEGKSTALVGPSGSGKSTIISLIERFYDPVQGTVLIDGRDLKSYRLRSLRKHMAMVSQEPTLFSGTIRENITYGSSEKANESEIISVAKAANAHDFITQLKEGYDTWCGDRGIQLSGGQKQRIAIARAILRNPSVLLLDEATSALDGPAERLVQDALERLMRERTSVVVAHRLSTIQNCDQIIVMDKGTVVERGTHTTLLEKCKSGAYYSLINLQQKIDH